MTSSDKLEGEGVAKDAATQIGELARQIFKLAPIAGLYVGITIEPARQPLSQGSSNVIR